MRRQGKNDTGGEKIFPTVGINPRQNMDDPNNSAYLQDGTMLANSFHAGMTGRKENAMRHDHQYEAKADRLICAICGFTVPATAIRTCATCGKLMPGMTVWSAGKAYCRMSCLPGSVRK